MARGGREQAEERGSEEERKQRSERDEQSTEQGGEGGREGAMEQRRGNFKGGTPRRTLASIQYTSHKTHVIETLVLQMKNSERVYPP